jgi:hypothetical protein
MCLTLTGARLAPGKQIDCRKDCRIGTEVSLEARQARVAHGLVRVPVFRRDGLQKPLGHRHELSDDSDAGHLVARCCLCVATGGLVCCTLHVGRSAKGSLAGRACRSSRDLEDETLQRWYLSSHPRPRPCADLSDAQTRIYIDEYM